MHSNRRRPHIIAVMLLLSLLLLSSGSLSGCAGLPADGAGSLIPHAKIKETTVIGVPGSLNEAAADEITRCVKVRPANGGRTVKLQVYRSNTGEFEDAAVFETEDADEAKVDITFPTQYQQKYAHSVWRIFVEASDKASEYVSPEFVLTAKNVEDAGINAPSACIYCVDDDQVLYDCDMNKRRHQASTTKIMSAIICVENAQMDDVCTVSETAEATYGSKVPLNIGDRFYMEDMLYTMMLPSNNDAASVIAETIGGSKEGFAELMNQKAAELDLANTHFINAHGLDEKGHYTTAYELCKTLAYAYGHEKIREVMLSTTHKYTCLSQEKEISVNSTDKMLGETENFKGGKTGYTDKANYCFAGVYEYKGKTYVISSLGSESDEYRWYDNRQLYKYLQKYAQSNA